MGTTIEADYPSSERRKSNRKMLRQGENKSADAFQKKDVSHYNLGSFIINRLASFLSTFLIIESQYQ